MVAAFVLGSPDSVYSCGGQAPVAEEQLAHLHRASGVEAGASCVDGPQVPAQP